MEQRAALLSALAPVLARLADEEPGDPGLAARLNAELPHDGPALAALAALVREGAQAGWLAPKGGPGLAFGRVSKPLEATRDFSIDAVVMDRPGPGHVHPRGEIDLCFALSGEPRFDGQPAGWVCYEPGSWHVPTVSGGSMAILYFLPGGAFQMAPEGPPS